MTNPSSRPLRPYSRPGETIDVIDDRAAGTDVDSEEDFDPDRPYRNRNWLAQQYVGVGDSGRSIREITEKTKRRLPR